MDLEDTVTFDERAKYALRSLRTIYSSKAPLPEKVDVQKKVFNLLLYLEQEGHDTTPYLNEVVDIMTD
ncbi:hypothetical protein GF343_04425 [Candidatus Woesearchaeota archaeon]|nr:hypothetical protein [Candidatus Woesearchaeota archaeon]